MIRYQRAAVDGFSIFYREAGTKERYTIFREVAFAHPTMTEGLKAPFARVSSK